MAAVGRFSTLFTAFLGESGDTARAASTVAKAITYVLLTVPRRAYEWFVFAALIGSLLGLGTLAASGELTALRAAGLSKLRICLSVALALGLLTGLVVVLVRPPGRRATRRSQAVQMQAKSSDITLAKGSGLWARDGAAVINAAARHHAPDGRRARGAPGRRARVRVH